MKKSFGNSFHRLSVVLMLALVALLLPGPVHAAAYDDFAGAGIDEGKWEIRGEGFSQPGDGFLHFSGTGNVSRTLVSKALFSSGIFTVTLSDYSCDNSAPSGRGLGSIAGFGLGDRTANAWVRFERGQIRPDLRHGISGGYIEVNWVSPNEAGSPIHVNWLPSEANSGALQIRYDGTEMNFFYRTGLETQWSQVMRTDREGRPVLTDGRSQPLVLKPG